MYVLGLYWNIFTLFTVKNFLFILYFLKDVRWGGFLKLFNRQAVLTEYTGTWRPSETVFLTAKSKRTKKCLSLEERTEKQKLCTQPDQKLSEAEMLIVENTKLKLKVQVQTSFTVSTCKKCNCCCTTHKVQLRLMGLLLVLHVCTNDKVLTWRWR